jgi:hypothetical protein
MLLQPSQRPQQGRLARAIPSHHSQHLTAGSNQIQAPKDRTPAQIDIQAGNLQGETSIACKTRIIACCPPISWNAVPFPSLSKENHPQTRNPL